MDLLQLDQELRAGKIRPCYVLAGEERHLVLTARASIAKAIFKEAPVEADSFDASKHPVHAVLDCLKTPSLLNPWRLVLVEEASHFKKADWEAIALFLASSPQKRTLVLIAEKFPAVASKAVATAAVVECKKLYPRQIPSWVSMEARRLNVPIAREAASYLIDCVGAELGELSQTLQKLSIFVGGKRLIQLEDVEKGVAATAKQNVFDLANAMGRRDLKKALKQLHLVLGQGEEPLKALALMARHYRLLARAGGLLGGERSLPEAQMAKALGVHPYFAKEYLDQAKGFKKSFFKKCFASLCACDKALKSSRHKPEVILEKLVRRLIADS